MIDPFFTISGFPGRNDFLIRQIFTYFIFDWHDRTEVYTIQLGIHEVRQHYVPALYTYQALVTGGCGMTAVTRIHCDFSFRRVLANTTPPASATSLFRYSRAHITYYYYGLFVIQPYSYHYLLKLIGK